MGESEARRILREERKKAAAEREATERKPVTSQEAYEGTGSNEELLDILTSHGVVTDPDEMRAHALRVTLINWRNASSKGVAAKYRRAKAELSARIEAESANAAAGSYAGRAEAAEAALARARQQSADLIAAWKQGNARRDRLDTINGQLQRAALEDALEQRTRAEQAENAAADLDKQAERYHARALKLEGQREQLRSERNAATARAEQAEAALAEMRDASGWTAAESAEFDKLYGTEAAMRYRAQLDRVWRVVQDLRDEAVAAGLDPYRDPMAQRLSAALVGIADATPRTALERAADEQGEGGDSGDA